MVEGQGEGEVAAEAGRHLRGEIKVIRRLVKLHVRQLDRADACAQRIEQNTARLGHELAEVRSELDSKLNWRQDRHLLLLTLLYVFLFVVTWFFR